jgi:hypothetical protein
MDVDKDGSTSVVLTAAAVCCFATTNAKFPVQRTAHHALKRAKTVARTANASTDVGSRVQNAKSLASGSASISNVPSCVVRCVTDLAVTSHV